MQVSPIDHVPRCFIPALFGHAEGDTFVRMRHSELLLAAYAGDKNLIKCVLWDFMLRVCAYVCAHVCARCT